MIQVMCFIKRHQSKARSKVSWPDHLACPGVHGIALHWFYSESTAPREAGCCCTAATAGPSCTSLKGATAAIPGQRSLRLRKKNKFALMIPKQDASDYCGGLCRWWSKSWHDMCKTYQVTHLLFPNLHFWSWAGHRDTNPELDSAGSYAYLLFELGQVGQVVHMFDSNYLDELH